MIYIKKHTGCDKLSEDKVHAHARDGFMTKIDHFLCWDSQRRWWLILMVSACVGVVVGGHGCLSGVGVMRQGLCWSLVVVHVARNI